MADGAPTKSNLLRVASRTDVTPYEWCKSKIISGLRVAVKGEE